MSEIKYEAASQNKYEKQNGSNAVYGMSDSVSSAIFQTVVE